jgi:hypothetical protein
LVEQWADKTVDGMDADIVGWVAASLVDQSGDHWDAEKAESRAGWLVDQMVVH